MKRFFTHSYVHLFLSGSHIIMIILKIHGRSSDFSPVCFAFPALFSASDI